MAFDYKRWCDCGKKYDGHDMDNHTCPECVKKKTEDAKQKRIKEKAEFIARFAQISEPAAIQELAAEIFEIKKELEMPS